MAGLSFTKYVKKVCGLLVIMPILALTGCGQGDGPVSVPNTAIPPLDPPPVGFCDPINFELECPNRIASLEEFEGGPITILANEKIDANNDSAVVARMQKFRAESGAGFGGGRLNLSIPFEVAAGDVFTMNVWSPRPVPVQMQAGIATVDVNHGGTGWEVLTFDLRGASGNVSSIAIIFENGTNGNADVDPDNWTFYFDDITLVPPSDPAVPIDPEVSLYDPPGEPDLDAEVTGFDSQSVINDMFADDSTYSPVLAVSSGVGYGANIAQIGFIDLAAGFASDYESLDFKVKGMPNNVIFVKLFDSVDSLRINLTSSAFSGLLTNGWYQVSIPISAFNGVSLATGIVFESDDTAPMQFTMLLNDLGFTEADDGGNGGTGGSIIPAAVAYSSDPAATEDLAPPEGFIQSFGSGAVFVDVLDDPDYDQVLQTTSGDLFGGDNIGFAAFGFYAGGFAAGYETFNFKVKGDAANLADFEVKFFGPGDAADDTVSTYDLASYAGSTDLGNGWYQVSVPMSDFDPAKLAINTGFLLGPSGPQDAPFTYLMTDIGFTNAGNNGGSGSGDCVRGPGPELATNGDIESGDLTCFDVFTDFGGVATADDTENHTDGGTWSIHAVSNGNRASTVIKQSFLAAGTVENGDTIDVSFWMKGTAGAGGVINPKVIAEGAGDAAVGFELVPNIPVPGADWTLHSYSQLVNADVTRGVTFEIAVVCADIAECTADVFIDDISVTIQ